MEVSKKDYNKVKNLIRSSIRKAFIRSDHYRSFIDSHRIEWKDGDRKRVSYKCECCGELFKKSEIQVDHIKPIGKGVYNDISDAPLFYKLVFCDHSNLQVLCAVCHKDKTKKEGKKPSYHNAIF